MSFPPQIAVTLSDLVKLEFLVTDFSLLPRQPVHSVLSGKHASKLRGRGLDFSEVRKYVYGDDIRNFDWKVTARTKVTHTKVFNDEKERPSFLVLDQSSSMFFASEGRMKSVIAAKMAAIGGFKVLKSGDRIGGMVFDDEDYEVIKPKRNRANLMRLLEIIVRKNQALPEREKISIREGLINEVLFRTMSMVTHDYVVTVISDFKKLNDEGRRYLTSIARHNDVIAVMVKDKMDATLPDVKIPFTDGDQQVLVKKDKKVQKNFSELAGDLRRENLNYFKKYGIPVMELDTSRELVDQLKELFGGRR